MSRETLIWIVVIAVGAVLLAVNAVRTGAGTVHVRAVDQAFVNVGTPEEPRWLSADDPKTLDHDLSGLGADGRIEWRLWALATKVDHDAAVAADPGTDAWRPSLARTIGVWVAAIFTLFIFSFLYRDNPFYKVAESIVVGVSAAYWMVVAFWGTLIPNLFGNLYPPMVRSWAMPNLDRTDPDLLYLVPLLLGVMLLWRLAPKGGWVSRWPMALIIGVFCGMRFVSFIHADFLSQIRATIEPLVVFTEADDGTTSFTAYDTIKNLVIFVGVLACLVYFFFSIEHKGAVGKTARLGIFILMITFGAGFGYTVMGRIALLAIRFEFLLDDWLWLIDPAGRRTAAVVEAAAATGGMLPFT